MPNFDNFRGANPSWGIKSVILYIEFISSYKIYKKGIALGGHVLTPCTPREYS